MYNSMATALGNEPKRWASTASMAHVLGMVVPYCLRQLSEWLSSGGMALGAPQRHAYMVSGACAQSAPLQAHGMHACVLTAGQQLRPWYMLSGAAHLYTCMVSALPATTERPVCMRQVWSIWALRSRRDLRGLTGVPWGRR